MISKRFWLIMGCAYLLLIFLKIFQHNQVVNLTYAKQKLQAYKEGMNRKKDTLLASLLVAKNQNEVKAVAQNKLNLIPLKHRQVVTTYDTHVHTAQKS